MIHVIAPGNEQFTAKLLVSALQRSCGQESAALGSFSLLQKPRDPSPLGSVFVLIHPREEWTDTVIKLLSTRTKVLLLGRLTTGLARYLQVQLAFEWPHLWAEGTLCAPAPAHATAESAAKVHYLNTAPRVAGRAPTLADRAFCRYDYADEWNNLGFGAITADGTSWSLAQHATLRPEHELAHIDIGDQHLCSYAGLWNLERSSCMWFNRAAGPVDSQEWRMVEDFLSCHRPDDLPCVPVLAEVPFGFDSAVTMRLDCDEDVESARDLWNLYCAEQVPFSLALHAQVLSNEKHHDLPREVLARGGAILSHTATHAPNWGGSHEAALDEGRKSADIIQHAIGHRVRYAVSPFHQTPPYARAGLADAGYQGCIGGIIRNDPDFLMARSGMPPGSGAGFIGHSQQCMLHGECMLQGSDPLKVFRQAFDMARSGGAFFGFLDHPFSERYAYGWPNEERRVAAHRDYIAYIRSTGGNVLWSNAEAAMDFLYDRAHIRACQNGNARELYRTSSLSRWDIAFRYRGDTRKIVTKGTDQ